MKEKIDLSEKDHNVGLTYSEIHLLLKAMDTFLEENPKAREYKTTLSIYQKLEPMHARISLNRRDLIRQSNSQKKP